ncbi:hypothetical protein SCLCIDRAFT_1115783 [Scleroderma citrinum Foug A]|uniref:Uncharacterized protein n=1 Tax=Scleroderma citrinum Foug A TaxID=1036808 RepID=A0A0C3DPM8_9AGAM|nr:hypothetical protein SCLCIDRAFT_1115783 [Scleroderma citrinum Foug A]
MEFVAIKRMLIRALIVPSRTDRLEGSIHLRSPVMNQLSIRKHYYTKSAQTYGDYRKTSTMYHSERQDEQSNSEMVNGD